MAELLHCIIDSTADGFPAKEALGHCKEGGGGVRDEGDWRWLPHLGCSCLGAGMMSSADEHLIWEVADGLDRREVMKDTQFG